MYPIKENLPLQAQLPLDPKLYETVDHGDSATAVAFRKRYNKRLTKWMAGDEDGESSCFYIFPPLVISSFRRLQSLHLRESTNWASYTCRDDESHGQVARAEVRNSSHHRRRRVHSRAWPLRASCQEPRGISPPVPR